MSIGAVLSSPVVAGATLYIGSWDGQLYAIG
jgi:outer membrane protein assembly factor BamB